MTLFDIEDLKKYYTLGGEVIHALDGIHLKIRQGDFLAIVGTSGSGKSTLMHILGLMDTPTSGSIRFEGQDVARLSENERAFLRATKIGFVFQAFNLLPRLSILENVLLPLDYSGSNKTRKSERGSLFLNPKSRAREVLERVGMSHRIGHRPSELSGGERQRVAIARAMMNQPSLILADEPTGNLDSRNVDKIMNLFSTLQQEGQTLVLVTHDTRVADFAQRRIRMLDGKIIEST